MPEQNDTDEQAREKAAAKAAADAAKKAEADAKAAEKAAQEEADAEAKAAEERAAAAEKAEQERVAAEEEAERQRAENQAKAEAEAGADTFPLEVLLDTPDLLDGLEQPPTRPELAAALHLAGHEGDEITRDDAAEAVRNFREHSAESPTTIDDEER